MDRGRPFSAVSIKEELQDDTVCLDEATATSSSDTEQENEPYAFIPATNPLLLQGELQHLLLKLQRQQTKQLSYLERSKLLNKEIQNTSRHIAKITRLLADSSLQQDHTPTTPQPHSRIDTSSHVPVGVPYPSSGFPVHLPTIASTSTSIASTSTSTATRRQQQQQPSTPDPPSLRTTPSPSARKRRPSHVSPRPNLTVKRATTYQRIEDAEVGIAQKIRHDTSPHPIVPPFDMPERLPYRAQELNVAGTDYCDLYLRRSQTTDVASLNKKPRSLMFSAVGTSNASSMKDIMVLTSLDGDLQFWNSSTRRNIKTLGREHLYPTWIEDLCWATPTTLALCPSIRRDSRGSSPQSEDRETVSLVHISAVTDTTVEGRVQNMETLPHTKGYSTIAPLSIDHLSLAGIERASFVTGGNDKSVYIWDLRRENERDDFDLAATHQVPLPHTSYPQTFLYDKYHSRLFSGGADDRFFMFDMEAQKIETELKFTGRVNTILQSPVSPNLLMISLSTKTDQLVLYDQRCSGSNAVQVRLGHTEVENVSRYIRPDWHSNGHMVVCGSQVEPKIHFWDLRYNGVARGPCFSFETMGKTKTLRCMFLPNRNTVLSLSSTRILTWTDYSVQPDSVIHAI